MKGARQADRPVAAQARLKKRDIEPRQGRARTIQGVAKSILSILSLETQIHPPSLIVFKVRAARYLEESVLSRAPNLKIIGSCRPETKIAGAEFDNPVMEPEFSQNCFRIGGQSLQLVG